MKDRTDGSMPEGAEPVAIGLETFPYIPAPSVLWRAFAFVVWTLLALWALDGIVELFVQYWFNTSLGFQTVFWTNVWAGAMLWIVGGTVVAVSITIPLRRYARSPALRAAALSVGAWGWLLGGRLASSRYQELLLGLYGGSFGETDPVFGHDIGFYVFRLPLLWTTFEILYLPFLLAMVAVVVARYDSLRSGGLLRLSLKDRVALILNPGFNALFYAVGFLGAIGTWLTRYELLFRDNESSGVRAGAEYLDVVGMLSTLDAIYVTVAVEIGLTLVIGYSLWRLYGGSAHLESGAAPAARPTRWRRPVAAVLALLAVDAAFFVTVAVRDRVAVVPNEPFIQKEFIERHMRATRAAYRLDDVEVIEWEPPDSPLTPEDILASRTVANVPILPGYVAYVERRSPDLQQAKRFEIVGTNLIYGPTLEIYEQQQQLRPYYSFLDVDAVRYRIDGEKRMFVSAVREIPSRRLVGPQDWLESWGTATLLYTHGLGLVMSPANAVDEAGEPLYVVRNIPPTTAAPELEAQPRIYYGEGGTESYVLTNIRHLREFDYATSQFRSEYVMPPEEISGVRIDSLLKRIVFGLWSVTRSGNDLSAFLFSDFIDPDRTRIHLKRSPLERVSAVAPFLFLDDGSVYAVVADGRIVWLVNSLTTSDRYPYSLREELGDKATDRAPEELQFPTRRINYAEDSVKAVIDAFSGALTLYKIADDPIVNAWDRIYPDLFRSDEEMPGSVRAHLTYPLQWFHIQFDDVYKRYHQRDYVEFYNLEDLWDDADEVLGPIGVGLTGLGTSDEATFSFEGYHMLVDAADLPRGPGGYWGASEPQFAMMMPFTPEGARNLRSLIVAAQDPGDYGKLYSLRIPQGAFVPGPEQADAMIDADALVNQQITLWVRHGAQVMAGHTLLVPVHGDVLYIQPIFVKSAQNTIPQIRLVSVVYRGRVTMAPTLEEAIHLQGTGPPPSLPRVVRQDEGVITTGDLTQ